MAWSRRSDAATRERWRQSQQRRQQWRQLTLQTRSRLQELYAALEPANAALTQPPQPLAAGKSEIFAQFRASYAQLRAQWLAQDEPLLTTPALRRQYLQRLARTDEWVAQANNASFGALAAYDDWVAAFAALWHESQAQADGVAGWQRFYARARQWAELPAEQRQRMLCRYLPHGSPRPPACAPP